MMMVMVTMIYVARLDTEVLTVRVDRDSEEGEVNKTMMTRMIMTKIMMILMMIEMIKLMAQPLSLVAVRAAAMLAV